MTKQEAIKWFKNIQNGKGVDTASFPNEMKGEIAKQYWDDFLFAYGIEYGILICLQKIYGITQGSLKDL